MSDDQSVLFDSVSGDLLPQYRDAYLQKQLPPALVPALEAYLKKSPIQTKILLGRYHELATAARRRDHTLIAPAWVQQQLLFQPTGDGVGPLRRPVVRVVLGLFALLVAASVVQWMRNEPLVSAPVVATVTQVATSAAQATQRLVRQLTNSAPGAAAPDPANPALAPAPTNREAAPRPPARPQQPAPVAALPTDSLAPGVATVPLPVVLPKVGSRGVMSAARPAPAGTVRGRISDAAGRSLAGATVLVKGTDHATSTNSTGYYTLEVPAGALLQFAYAGCFDQVLPNTGTGTMNVTLQPQQKKRAARR